MEHEREEHTSPTSSVAIANAFEKKVIGPAGEAGAQKRLASPAHRSEYTIRPWHRGKND